ncbi:iron ABC transporter permease [Globicatella sulfidifaciens]|uniref:Iron ABC transporter permease n=1 Tax=Globicatella sulfidifaciens TaxID=136093 RepID=A0A7X8C1Q6_9LACT|nr:iron ABC transporter permease [Globicatella sulfidifaciens]NLJ17335.1 iron ABC transporter permease [Globicatella sulfidifaciens]
MNKINKSIQSFLIGALGIFIFIMPLLTLFALAFETEGGFSLQNFNAIFSSSRSGLAIKNTLIVGGASTVLAFLLGGLYAFMVAYTNVKYKKLLEILIILPYLIPGYIVTLAWTSLFSGNGVINRLLMQLGLPKVSMYSLGGIIFVLGVSNAALVYLNLVDVLRKIPQEQEQASQVAGYSLKETLMKINLKSVRGPILSAIVLSFLSAIDNFAIPITLGTPGGISVLSTYIYEKAIGFGPTSFNEASALAIVLSSVSLVAVLIQKSLTLREKPLESQMASYHHRLALKPVKRRLLQTVLIVLLVILNIIPLIFMFLSSLHKGYVRSIFDVSHMSLANYQFILTTPGMYSGFLTSLWLTLSSLAVCLLIGVWVMYMKSRYQLKSVFFVETGASLTYSVPGIVLALSMIFYWGKVPNVYGTMLILWIAYVTRYALLLIRGSQTAFMTVGPELEEAAIVSGSSSIEKWFKIIFPMIRQQLLSSSFLMIVGALTELTLSSLLSAANSKTIGLTIFALQTGGDNAIAQAYSVLLTLLILTILMMRSRWENKEGKSK